MAEGGTVDLPTVLVKASVVCDECGIVASGIEVGDAQGKAKAHWARHASGDLSQRHASGDLSQSGRADG